MYGVTEWHLGTEETLLDDVHCSVIISTAKKITVLSLIAQKLVYSKPSCHLLYLNVQCNTDATNVDLASKSVQWYSETGGHFTSANIA